jgi:hypothetical protein
MPLPAIPITLTVTVAGRTPVVIDPVTFDGVAVDDVAHLAAALKASVATAIDDAIAAAKHAPCILCGKNSGRLAASLGSGAALCAACVAVAGRRQVEDRCDACGGAGFIVSAVDDGHNLERCDACHRLIDDEHAAAVVRDGGL